MVIPRSFEIFGLTFKVKQPWKVDKDDHWGECSIAKKTIKIKRSLDQPQKEITYLHEVTHAILDCLEYNDLSNDEDFVERFSKAMHQVIKSSK